MSERRIDAVCLGLVVLLSLVVRVLWVEQAEIGGDAVEKWHFVKQWFHAFSFAQVEWDHHRARFGVNLVAFVVQAVFGDGPLAYWVAPALASTLCAAFVWGIARELVEDPARSRVVATLAASAYVLFPPTVRAGSQLLPEVFTAAYACGATLLVLVYARAPRMTSPALWGAATLVFLGYSAKETGLFFAPGLFVMIAMLGRVRDGFVFGGVMAVWFAVESAFFMAVSPYTTRLGVVAASHGAHPRRETVDNVLGLVTRYHKLQGAWVVVLVAFVLALSMLVKGRQRWRRVLAVALVPASFLFFFTFMVRKLNPITLWARTLDRYLDAVAPLVLLIVVVTLALVLAQLLPARSAGRALARPLLPLAVVGGLVGVAIVFALARTPFSRHPIRHATRAAAAVTDTYARGLPFHFQNDARGKTRRGAFSLYVDSDLLVRDGALMRFEDLGLDAKRLEQPAPKDACVLRLRSKRSKIYLKPQHPLPASCAQARSAAPTP